MASITVPAAPRLNHNDSVIPDSVIPEYVVSDDEFWPAVAVGFGPIAEHKNPGGVAICIGPEPIASAGPGGYLVFLNLDSGAPKAHIFAVGENGIEPNVPYLFMPGMNLPERADEDPDYELATRRARTVA